MTPPAGRGGAGGRRKNNENDVEARTPNDDFVLFWHLSQPHFPDDISKLFTTDFVQPILQRFVTC